MSTENVICALDEALPDSLVKEELGSILRQEAAGARDVSLEIDEGRITVPVDVQVDIVTKAFFKEYCDVGFSTGYRVQIAIGGVSSQKHGIVKARHCFATLYFNRECHRFSIDFHSQMR